MKESLDYHSPQAAGAFNGKRFDNRAAGLPALLAYLFSWLGSDGGVHGPVVHRSDLKRLRAIHDTPWTQHAVIEGLLELYRRSGKDYWLEKAVQLADSQCSRLEPAGHFRWAGHEDDRFSSLIHNALADCALLAVADELQHTSDRRRRERYLNSVERNLIDYVIGELYRPRLGGFVMNPIDHYIKADRFISNMNSVALEAFIKLDLQRGTSRFRELVDRVAGTVLSQQIDEGPCRGSFCYSHLERDFHIPLYTALTLRGLPALMQYTSNPGLQEVAKNALFFLDRALDPDTRLWVHEVQPNRMRRYPIFVAGAGIVCNGILEATQLTGTAVNSGDLAARLLQHQYPNGAIRNFIGYDHPDNGRPRGRGKVCWEDVYPTPNWNAQAFRFLCRVLPPPMPMRQPRLLSFYLSSRPDAYFYVETSRISFIAGGGLCKGFLLAFYLKRFRHGLVAHMPTKAIFSAAKRLASYTREAKIKSKTGSHSLGVNASFFRHRQSGHRILLATNHTFPPQRVGGSESSIHNLSVALLGKGFNVSVFSTWSADEAGAEQYVAAADAHPETCLITDRPFGYTVFRSPEPLRDVDAVVRSARPTTVIVNATGEPISLAYRFLECGIPAVVYVRDALFEKLGARVCERNLLRFVTTSHALATSFKKKFGFRPAAIPPIVLPELYKVESKRKYVTFVCPFPQKGVEIALKLAEQRPDIPFMFVESWPMDAEMRYALMCRVRALKNVFLRERTQDIREVYRETKIVLAPSKWFEAWGRVVSEAQVSGIPALASEVGGLPEAVGSGGFLVRVNAGMDEWQKALSAMWDCPKTYDRLAAAAYRHAQRREFSPEVLLQRLFDVIETTAPGNLE